MDRRLAAFAALVLAMLSGCAMCQSPFDYCGPVSGPNGCPNCDFGARRGSLFAPMDGTADGDGSGPTLATEGAAAESIDAGYPDAGNPDTGDAPYEVER
jgi:hypothetical protein